MKSIEIYYNIDDIPGGEGILGRKALNFRNDAMHLIESAMESAGLGEWEGAEIGSGEVNFGFSVEDFDVAEAAVREAVAGTEYEGIREIRRHEYDPTDFEDIEDFDTAGVPLKFRILIVVLPLLLLPFLLVSFLLRTIARMFSR